MRLRTRVALGAAATAAAIGLTCTGPEPALDPRLGHLEGCLEDTPCWDCETMGNLTCGPLMGPDDGPERSE